MNTNTKYKFNMKGWFKDSWRHMLAAKGIKTKRYMARIQPIRKGRVWNQDKEDETRHELNRMGYSDEEIKKRIIRLKRFEKSGDTITVGDPRFGVGFKGHTEIIHGPEDKWIMLRERQKRKYDANKLEAVREQARQKMEKGDPLSKDELESFTEHPFPGMQILKFRKVDGGYKMTGGLFGGEPGFEKDFSFEKALEDAKKSKKYQAEKPFSWLTQSVKKKKVGSYKDSESGE